MNESSLYLHTLDGRIGIKLAAVKGSPAVALAVEAELRGCPGVVEVKANPVTDNVLVLYDPGRVEQAALLELLQPFDTAPPASGSRAAARQVPERPTAAERLAETVMTTVIEAAMRQLVAALI